MMARKKRRKRKSRTELYVARKTKTYFFVTRRSAIPVRGGNQFGLGEWTLRVAGMGFLSGD